MSYDHTARAAVALGMPAPPRPTALARAIRTGGRVAGRPVSILETGGKTPALHVSAPLDPPLDLGLTVARATSLVEVVRGWLGAVDVTVGDPAFDGAFAVRADAADRARALLDPGIRAAMLGFGAWDVVVRDEDVTAVAWAFEVDRREDPAELPGVAHAVASLASRVDAARDRVPPPADAGHLVPGLLAFAEAHGLVRDGLTPLRLRGVVDGIGAWIGTSRVARGDSSVSLGARLAEPLPFWFRARTRARGFGASLWARDRPIGDDAFDDAFDVEVGDDDVERLRAALDGEARAALTGLTDGRVVDVGPAGIAVHDGARDFDASSAIATLHAVVDVVRRVGRPSAAAGAYR